VIRVIVLTGMTRKRSRIIGRDSGELGWRAGLKRRILPITGGENLNAKNRILGLVLAMVPAVCWAQVKVEIPKQVGEHQLAVIKVEAGDGLEVDIEVWKSLDQSVPYRELKAASGREFGFVAPPGEYLVRVYGWKAGSVEKYSGKVVIGGPPQPEPGPIDPVDPDNGLTGLAKVSYEAAMKVFSVTREQEAKELARVYSSVSSQSAALPNMTAAQMTQQVRESNRDSMNDEAKAAWSSWAAVISRELETVSDKQKLIEAYRDIARGLEKVK
jgi:hypothetical protein